MRPSRKPSVAKSDPCTALTPKAIQDIIDKIEESGNMAKKDVSKFGVNGTYAIATQKNLGFLRQAHKKMTALQVYLQKRGLASPYVTNASGAYNVNQYTRMTIAKLLLAQHWATISAVYHTSNYARDSFEMSWQAITMAEALGANAGRCYMKGYFP